MDPLIRAMPVSSDTVTLSLRRRGSMPGSDARARLVGASRDRPPESAASPESDATVPDPGLYERPAPAFDNAKWLEEERARLRDELNRELQERAAVAEEEGRRRGYEAGIVRGQQEGLRAFEEGAAKIDGVLRAVHDRFVAEISGVEDTLVSIVFEAVCRILGDTLVKPESVRAVVRQVLARVRDQERIVVRVAPADYELLTHATRLLRLQNGARRRVELVADDRVILGGCLIETDGGNLDARLEMQVQQLRDVLLAARQAPPE